MEKREGDRGGGSGKERKILSNGNFSAATRPATAQQHKFHGINYRATKETITRTIAAVIAKVEFASTLGKDSSSICLRFTMLIRLIATYAATPRFISTLNKVCM
jgi:hypothetical protein